MAMSRDLGIDVVATGVERDSQGAQLIDFGCPLGRGHLFARPLPVVVVRAGR